MVSRELPRRAGPGGRGAHERILAAALVLFRDQGINATGVTELAAAAQVSKRTLYQYFPSKDEVIVAYLQACAGLGPEAALERVELTPRARLLELFSALGEQRRPLRGDPFVNAAVELADPEHPARQIIARHQERLVERLTAVAREAGARPAERLAQRLALLYAGAAAQMVAGNSPEPAAEAYTLAAALLDEAIA